jgi:hypothetical protein
VGINQLTWRQLLRSLTDELLAAESYAEPLPAGYLDEPSALAHRLADHLSTYAAAVSGLDAGATADDHTTRFLSDRTPALRGGLADLVGLGSLTDATVLERRATAACVVRTGSEAVAVLLGDRELRMPLRLAGLMTFVRDHPSFRVGDLAPWLDERSRLVVARRLVREGLLRIAG